MLQNKLDYELLKKENLKDHPYIDKVPKIIMNPETWEKLVEEIIGEKSSLTGGFQNLKADLRYKGLMVLRSPDMIEGEFIIR